MSKVTVYSTQHCQYCRMVKAFLDKYGVPYENIDVGTDRGGCGEDDRALRAAGACRSSWSMMKLLWASTRKDSTSFLARQQPVT